MSLFVPASLLEQIRERGGEGEAWLHSLPERIAELERAWRFHTGRAFDHGGCASWVAPVTLAGGADAVLKIGIPHDEARYEAEALRMFNGRGAVRLLESSADGFSLLLERCSPGLDLWPLSEEDGDAVAADILPRLWRRPEPNAPFQSLADLVALWRAQMPLLMDSCEYDRDLATRAIELGGELAANQPQCVLLHGDFHPGNVLSSQRESWLAIDPKSLVGDPAYDLAQWLSNRMDAAILTGDPVSALREQIVRFAAHLALDPLRIAGWAFVKALGWDWGAQALELFSRVRLTL